MIRVLVVDDSAILRQQIRSIFQGDPKIKIVGEARNGEEAIVLPKRLRPDVSTMDIRMPKMDRFEAIHHIMAESPTPIVVVTSMNSTRGRDPTPEATKLGAVAVLKRPMRTASVECKAFAAKLIEQVKLVSQVKVVTRSRMGREVPPRAKERAPKARSQWPATARQIRIVAIGSSTGGPAALYKVLGSLPADFHLPILIVQHISFGFVEGLAGWLDGGCQLRVKVADHGERMRPGVVYISPDGDHMVADQFGRLRLRQSDLVSGHRPSATVLFASVADAYGPAALGVILTGMGADGAEGIKTLKERGAMTIAQDEKSCVVFGMPKEAIALGAIRHIVPLEKMTQTIIQFCSIRQAIEATPASLQREGRGV